MIGSISSDSAWVSARRHAAGPAVFAVLATLGFLFGRFQMPQDSELVLRLYVFGIGLACLWLTIAVISEMHRSSSRLEIELALHRPGYEPRRPVQLEEIESRVRFALASAFDYDHRLRPLVREMAAERVATRGPIDVASTLEDARARLGDELWQALYEEHPSAGRDSPGPSLAMLRSLIDAVESL